MHPNGDRIFLKFGDRRKIAAELKVCWVVVVRDDSCWSKLGCPGCQLLLSGNAT
jgi:hypothetical protein